ncbi:MAG: hypothetical protein V1853_00940 [bacterium]
MATRQHRIIPAVLTRYTTVAQKRINRLKSLSFYLHLDLMDGQYVKTKSYGPDSLKKLRLPKHTTAHLMVKQPDKWLKGCLAAGIKRLIIHVDADITPEFIKTASLEFDILLALKPGAPIRLLQKFVPYIIGVHVLTVKPGKQGSAFLPKQIEVIRAVHKKYPRLIISVDGSIGVDTIGLSAKAGANDIIVGSVLRDAKNPRQTLKYLSKAIHRAKKRETNH